MVQYVEINTPGRASINITNDVNALLRAAPVPSGVAHLFIQHTSASLTIQENADPDVQKDLVDWLDKIAPEDSIYRHHAEGPDDMPAHLKSAITSTSLSIPFENRKLLTGTWQGIYLLEHRIEPHTRRIAVTILPSV